MPAVVSAVRNTCFAILSAIETDVRALIDFSLSAQGRENFLPPDVRDNAIRRFVGDSKSGTGAQAEDESDLLDYLDFGDLAKVLNNNASSFSPHSLDSINQIARELSKLAAARNRVCHSRPLEEDDLFRFIDLSSLLLSRLPEFSWEALHEVEDKRQKDPSFVFRLEIPAFWRLGSSDKNHNLPLPDFDETGFIGRGVDRKELMKHLSGPHPVITLIGEGGIGKTALALSSAYALLDLPDDQQFDTIVWVSLKARVLTPAGIRDIRDSVISTIGVLQTAALQMGSPLTEPADTESLIVELHQYMGTLRIFLVIDNLETLPTDSLRSFLSAIPDGSKVLITSRVGLGELELRYKLDPLDEKTSLTLIRKFARSLNLELLFRAKDEILKKYTRLLFNSPLLIKWFVSSIANGADPSKLVSSNSKNFSEAITFCFENLFVRLSSTEKLLLYFLASARRPLTQTELLFLTQETNSGEMGTPDVEQALNVFHNSSMVRRSFGEHDTGGLEISLTDIASEYLSRVSPPPREIVVATQARLRQLRELSERSIIKQSEYKYDLFAIRATNKEERIAGAYLQFALQALRVKDFVLTKKRLEQARAMLPNWSEVYRIYSIVEDRAGNVAKALDFAETAVECNPNSSVALYQLALYLFQTIEDSDQALTTIDAAIAHDPTDETLISLKALILTRTARFSEAALLYEGVLKNISNRPRKWRIPTRDQAAECYRRWAQQDFVRQDFVESFRHTERAADILLEGVDKGEFDNKTLFRLSHVLEDSIERAIPKNNRELLFWSLQKLTSPQLQGKPLNLNRSQIEAIAVAIQGDPQAKKLWDKWMDQSSGTVLKDVSASGASFPGVIKAKVQGKKFGFIQDRSGYDWFFHEEHLLSDTWSSVWEGRRVTFEKSKSNGRPCAVKVKLL